MSNPLIHNVNPAACPRCKKVIERQMSTLGYSQAPRAGDFSICASCGFIAVFDEGFGLRTPTALDCDRIKANRRIYNAMMHASRDLENKWRARRN